MFVTDPYRAFRFRVEIMGLEVGGFQSVSGLERQTKIEPYREGGVNDHERQHAGVTTYPPLRLKRGLADPWLWAWHQAVILGRIQRLIMSVVLLGEAGTEDWRWIFIGAYPSKWTGSDLDASQSVVATETIEFVHHGLVGI
ncbi:MAG TPA: phage tail protein [Allosphingosinicella sp.]|nr:phage tail protein [Allosphingosinicella sp.]